MIRRLELAGWRAYDALDLELPNGTVFIVARNGIGKTSLIDGACYALFGDLSPIDPVSARRRGHTRSRVAVEIVLPDTTTLRAARATDGKRTNAEFTHDGAAIDEDRYRQLLSGACSTTIDSLARLTFLPAGSLTDYRAEALQIRKHLAQLFGVESLSIGAAAVDDLARSTASQLRKANTGRRADKNELDELHNEVSTGPARLADAQATVDAIAAQVASARELARVRHQWETHAELATRHGEAATAIGSRVGLPGTDRITLGAAIAKSIEELDDNAQTVRRNLGRAEGRREALTESLAALESGAADCPICRRPLDEHTVADAASSHRSELADLDAAITDNNVELAGLEERRMLLLQAKRDLDALTDPGPRPPAPESDESPSLPALEQSLATAQQNLGEVRAHISAAEQRIDTLNRDDERHRQVVALHRRAALIDATRNAIDETITTIMDQRIEPLASEMAARWKRVFGGSRPSLQLTSAGEVVLERNGEAIAFSEMSAGERAVAVLTTRLLALSAATPHAFMWLDEPFEQLDPVNRRIVALMVADAGRGALSQIVAMTFEEEIARRLSATHDDVSLLHVTAGE